jgi:hypothetical protein
MEPDVRAPWEPDVHALLKAVHAKHILASPRMCRSRKGVAMLLGAVSAREPDDLVAAVWGACEVDGTLFSYRFDRTDELEDDDITEEDLTWDVEDIGYMMTLAHHMFDGIRENARQVPEEVVLMWEKDITNCY